jgi:hypothetical protein
LPLVAALTNPHGAWVFLDELHMVYAMYGDPVVRMTIDPTTGAAVGDPEPGVRGNGRLARDHQYISAVVVISERDRAADWRETMRRRYAELPWLERLNRIDGAVARGESPEGAYHRASVFKTLSPSATPLPDVFFTGDDDQVFEPNHDAPRAVAGDHVVRALRAPDVGLVLRELVSPLASERLEQHVPRSTLAHRLRTVVRDPDGGRTLIGSWIDGSLAGPMPWIGRV